MLPRQIVAVATALLLHLPLGNSVPNGFNTFQNGLQVLNQGHSQQQGQQLASQQAQGQQNQTQQSQNRQTESQQQQQGQQKQAQQPQATNTDGSGQCYLRNGSLDPNGIPCFSDDNASRCCGTDEYCSTNKLCVSKTDANKFSSGSCVDPTFQAASCPNVCQGCK